MLCLLLVLGITVPIRYQHRGGIQGFTLDEAVVIALFAVWGVGWVPLAHVLAATIAHATRRADTSKVAFNAGQVGLSTAVAAAVFHVVGAYASVLSIRGLAAVLAAVAAWNVVNSVVLAGLFRALEGRSVLSYLRDVGPLNVVTSTGNVCAGLLLVLVADADWRGLVVAGFLLIGLFFGYRGYSAALEEQRRTELLARLNQSLALVAAGSGSFERWLDDIRLLFSASSVLLRLAAPGGVEEHVVGDADEASSATASAVMAGEASSSAHDQAVVLSTPLVDGGTTVGAIVLAGRRGLEPWGSTDATLLAAIASEAAVALRSAELFQQVERERARWQEDSSKLNDILSAASDGIATLSPAGDIVSWNPGMAALTGVEATRAVGQPWWVALRMRDTEDVELLPGGEHVITSALAGERHADPAAVQVLRRDGQWRRVRATFSPLVTEDGGIDGTVIVARDVTAEHEVEELKADFVATVSHELRTPLTPLKGFLATVRYRSDMLTQEQIAMLHRSMESQVHRLERLVNDLLVVADLDRGRVALDRELVTLRQAAELAVSEEQDPAEQRVELVGDGDLVAAADTGAVVRILRALVSNALKHAEGTVTVELARDGTDVLAHVRDHGPGIPPWEQDRIFRRFHRLGDHLHRTQGAGLGLAIARALADHLGGGIEVDSDVGRGATFTLRLRSAAPVPVPATTTADAG